MLFLFRDQLQTKPERWFDEKKQKTKLDPSDTSRHVEAFDLLQMKSDPFYFVNPTFTLMIYDGGQVCAGFIRLNYSA